MSCDIQSSPVCLQTGRCLPSISSEEQSGSLRSADLPRQGQTAFTPLLRLARERRRYYEPLRLPPRPADVFGVWPSDSTESACAPVAGSHLPHPGRSRELRSPSLATCRPDDPAAAPGPRAPVAWPRDCRLRPVHKGSTRGLICLEARMGSRGLEKSAVLRPAVSRRRATRRHTPRPSRGRQLKPNTVHFAVVARASRPCFMGKMPMPQAKCGLK